MIRTDKIEEFKNWNKVTDYESDEFTVDLLNSKGNIIGIFYYPRFTREDFNYYKKIL